MKKLKLNIQTAFYYIKKNKSYFFFNVTGVALTFLFINIILQIVYTQVTDTPPNINTGRIISLSSLENQKGESLYYSEAEISSIVSEIKECEAFSLTSTLERKTFVNGKRGILYCCYASTGLWDIKSFTLLKGRFFTQEEYDSKTPVTLVRESTAKACFTGTAIGKKVEIKGKEFEVIGVIQDYPFQFESVVMASFWLPYTFWDESKNRDVEILFSQKIEMDAAKQLLARQLNLLAEKKGESDRVEPVQIYTIKELKNKNLEGILMASSCIVFLLLLIPAVNMLALNMANNNSRTSEIAIQRAFGAPKSSIYVQIITENVLMNIVGALVGISLSYPFMSYVERFLLPPAYGGFSLTMGVSLSALIFVAFPLILILSGLISGIPAYLIANQNIANILKGGAKC